MKRKSVVDSWKVFWSLLRESIIVTSLVAFFVVILTGVMVYQAREIPKEWWILTSGVVTFWFSKAPVKAIEMAIRAASQ